MSARSEALKSKRAVAGFRKRLSARGRSTNGAQVDPWLRDVLASLEGTLTTIVETQAKLAEQIDQQGHVMQDMANHLRRQERQR